MSRHWSGTLNFSMSASEMKRDSLMKHLADDPGNDGVDLRIIAREGKLLR